MFQLIFDAQSNIIQCVRIFINLNFKIFYDLFFFLNYFLITNISFSNYFRNITIQFYFFLLILKFMFSIRLFLNFKYY